MKIHFLRHATSVVTLGDLTLLVDPMRALPGLWSQSSMQAISGAFL
ncbi:MAG: hypothetical protein ACJ8CB_31445 [Ktedonobacteraceae bacterium]